MIYEVLRGSQDLQPLYNDDIIVWHWQAIVVLGGERSGWVLVARDSGVYVCLCMFVSLYARMRICVCESSGANVLCTKWFFFRQLLNQDCAHHELLLAS